MTSSRFNKLFTSSSSRAAIIGMIHVPALPGVVFANRGGSSILSFCLHDSRDPQDHLVVD